MVITRDAFLYMAPKAPKGEFAQCGTCRDFIPGTQRCIILPSGQEVFADSSCGLYVRGRPLDDREPNGAVTAKEAGLVHRQVRCENCKFFDGKGTCCLYQGLNAQFPAVFDLDVRVDEYGCCNANESA